MICLSHQGNIIAAAYEFIFFMSILGFIILLLILVAIKLLGKAPEKTIFDIKYKHIKVALWFILWVPLLQTGVYYIALNVKTLETEITGRLTATA